MKKMKINTGNQTTFPERQLPISQDKDNNEDEFQQSYGHSVVSQITNPDQILRFFIEYKPHNKHLNYQELRQSQYLKLKKYKESMYYGEFINGKKQGTGIMLYENKRVYEGEWESDQRHGYGYEGFPNGCIYQGDYINGKPEGIGRYTWPNGQFYEGQWSNGLKEGKGMWKGAKGDEYVGQWKFGKAQGFGVHKWINGDMYQGQFKECLKHGEGIQRFSNGDIYRGRYINGKPFGFGQYYWENGSYFKGKFKNGLRDGQGLWKRGAGNCDKYEGDYENDKKSGYGIFTWSTGNVYKGNYDSDVRNGHGQMYWNDGSYYKGSWKSGVQHGEGQLFIPGQGLKRGIFEDNILIIIEHQSSLTNQTNNLPTESEQMPVQLFEKTENKRRMNKNVITNEIKKKTIPSDKSFRRREFSSKRKDTIKSIDQTTYMNYQKLKGQKHPLIPRRYYRQEKEKEKRYDTLDASKSRYQNQNPKKDRILHSSFYMHKLHNRASTSIQKSRDKISNMTSALGDNETHKIDLFEQMKTFKRNKAISSTRNKL